VQDGALTTTRREIKMTRETLTRPLRGRRRSRGGIDHRPPVAARRDERDALLDSGVDVAAETVSAPPPEPRVTDWSAHRMASFLVLLAAAASEEPVDEIDRRAIPDVLTGGVLDRSGAVTAHGRLLLEEFRLDQPIPVERRPATEEASAVAGAR
jgi:hypothetical protein